MDNSATLAARLRKDFQGFLAVQPTRSPRLPIHLNGDIGSQLDQLPTQQGLVPKLFDIFPAFFSGNFVCMGQNPFQGAVFNQ